MPNAMKRFALIIELLPNVQQQTIQPLILVSISRMALLSGELDDLCIGSQQFYKSLKVAA